MHRKRLVALGALWWGACAVACGSSDSESSAVGQQDAASSDSKGGPADAKATESSTTVDSSMSMDSGSPDEMRDSAQPSDAEGGSSVASDAQDAPAPVIDATASVDARDGFTSVVADADAAATTSDADAATVPDAPSDGGPFACSGQPLPTTAPSTVTVNGITRDQLAALTGVAVDVFPAIGSVATATTTSAADGSFTIGFATGGVPYDGYVRLRRAGYLDSYVYPSAPLAADWGNGAFAMLSPQNAALLPVAVGVSQSASNGMVGLRVIDCAGASLAGATVTTSPASELRYVAGGIPSATATMTDATGLAYAFNVPVGSVTVSAARTSTQLRSHVITVRAGALTITTINP